jgi:hypothetical protein
LEKNVLDLSRFFTDRLTKIFVDAFFILLLHRL